MRGKKAKNRGDKRGQNLRARALIRAFINSFKCHPCVDCNQSFPTVCMDFDHVRGTKEFNVSTAVTNGISQERIESEIDKCELVCANCHRVRTANRRHTKIPPAPKKGGRPRLCVE